MGQKHKKKEKKEKTKESKTSYLKYCVMFVGGFCGLLLIINQVQAIQTPQVRT